MKQPESSVWGRSFDLPTQQRRLRHLHSVAARNITCPSDQDLSRLETYFTLHHSNQSPAFYTSETIRGSLNPTWRTFNLTHFAGEKVCTSSTSFVIRVWCICGDQKKLSLEWDVHLSGLAFIGSKLQDDTHNGRPDTLIFGMFDVFFGIPVSTPKDAEEKERGVFADHLKVDQASVKESYSVNSLSRIQMVLRAIKQTRASVKKVRSSISDKLLQSQIAVSKEREQDLLKLRIGQLRKDLERRTAILKVEKENLETQQAKNHQEDVKLRNVFDSLQKDKNRLDMKKRSYFDIREDLIKTAAQLVLRRKQLISELALIYPITEARQGHFQICNVHLPNSEAFAGQDEIMIAVALGSVVHLVEMISEFLDVPLRYPMEHRSSRSRIHDHILDKLTDKDRDFPLHSKGKERFQFNYGVFLLNKNIAQLRNYCFLGTTDLRPTLANLKHLLELRLGVRFDTMRGNTLTSMPGQHIPIPPNFGGPQRQTSGKSMSLPRSRSHQLSLASTTVPFNDQKRTNLSLMDDIIITPGDATKLLTPLKVNDKMDSGVLAGPSTKNTDASAPTRSDDVETTRNGGTTDSAEVQTRVLTKIGSDELEVASEAVENEQSRALEEEEEDDEFLQPVFKQNQIIDSIDSMSIPDHIRAGVNNHCSEDRTVHVSSDANSKFKMWPSTRGRLFQSDQYNSDDSGKEDPFDAPRPAALNLDLSDLYKTRSLDDLDSHDFESGSNANSATVSDENEESENSSSNVGAISKPSEAEVLLLNSGMDYDDDRFEIQQRTDALLNSQSSFRITSQKHHDEDIASEC